MKYKNVLFKSLKINFFGYISFILSSSFAIMINFIYSTVILNKYILKNNESTLIKYVVNFSVVYIMVSICIFIVYSYDNYMKWRTKEFTTLILLGTTRKELKRLLLIESFILLSSALILGTCFGMVFSKIFFLSIMKLCGVKNIPFEITYKNYLNIAVLFLLIYSVMLYKICRIFKFLNVKDILKYKNKPMILKGNNRGLKSLVITIIACVIYKKISINIPKSMELYVTNIFISMIVAYLVFTPFVMFINIVLKKFKFKIYIQIKSMKSILCTSRKLTFLLSFLSFMLIEYIRINYKYNLQYKTMGSLFVSSKFNFIVFIYFFTMVLCFIIFSTIIFYKISFGIPMMKKLYNTLLKTGITENEFKKLIKFNLHAAFGEPFILSLFMSAVYIEISNVLLKFSLGTVLIYLVYFFVLIVGYFAAKRKCEDEIFK
ncbi:FtsX-like permease family protein [Clostridium hydrogenum]|uniref:FtsX-like permease family protein n=1 Tax=Clostridium hydrogenum TaxID=2855764 RepID=UPI001F188511|nr:FtsX-like permease family protein [Clostridium hydrogenum]